MTGPSSHFAVLRSKSQEFLSHKVIAEAAQHAEPASKSAAEFRELFAELSASATKVANG